MKNLSANQLAFLIATLAVFFETLGLIFLALFDVASLDWRFVLIETAVVYLVIYLIVRYVLYKYIVSKIKVVYRSIQKQKLTALNKENKFSYSENILGQVDREVVEWVEDRKKEIDQLKQMESYRKEFVGNVSHELKTPIFVIQGYILTLLDGGLEDENINRKYLEKAEKSINRMITIVQDLETISRLEQGELKLEYTRFDICYLVKDIFESLENKAEDRGIELVIKEGYDRPVFVSGDADRIRQVLVNLIVNAINYGNDNGFVRLAFYDMDENYLVEVKDNGIGIDAVHISRLFERFYRADKGRSMKSGGTGLGLSIVKHIIEAHSQTLNVKSTPGEGSAFTFTLKKA